MIRTRRFLPLFCWGLVATLTICSALASDHETSQNQNLDEPEDAGSHSETEQLSPRASTSLRKSPARSTTEEKNSQPSTPRSSRRKKSGGSLSSSHSSSSTRRPAQPSSARDDLETDSLIRAAASLHLQEETGPVARAQPSWLSSVYNGALGLVASQRRCVETEITNNTFLNTYPNEDDRTRALWSGLDDLSNALEHNILHKYCMRASSLRQFAHTANIPILSRQETRLLRLALAQRAEADALIVAIMSDPKNQSLIQDARKDKK